MRVGLILEYGPGGADQQVCETLVKVLRPGLKISSVTLDNKPNLVAKCGEATAALLSEGCERVVIVWDLYPPWRTRGERPCRREDRETIQQSLTEAGVTSPNVYLVCIQEELEAWLIADERALSSVLSRPSYSVRVKRFRHPEAVRNPKARLTDLFRQHLGRSWRYNDRRHAPEITRAMPDLTRLKRCKTFVRFALKVADVDL